MPTPDSPASSGPSVTLPLALFDRMSLCYYGNGPRHRENTTDPRPPMPELPQQMGGEAIRSGTDPGSMPVRVAPVVNAIPRGINAPRTVTKQVSPPT